MPAVLSLEGTPFDNGIPRLNGVRSYSAIEAYTSIHARVGSPASDGIVRCAGPNYETTYKPDGTMDYSAFNGAIKLEGTVDSVMKMEISDNGSKFGVPLTLQNFAVIADIFSSTFYGHRMDSAIGKAAGANGFSSGDHFIRTIRAAAAAGMSGAKPSTAPAMRQ